MFDPPGPLKGFEASAPLKMVLKFLKAKRLASWKMLGRQLLTRASGNSIVTRICGVLRFPTITYLASEVEELL